MIGALEELENAGYGKSEIGSYLQRSEAVKRRTPSGTRPRCISGQRSGKPCGEPSIIVLDGMPYCAAHDPRVSP